MNCQEDRLVGQRATIACAQAAEPDAVQPRHQRHIDVEPQRAAVRGERDVLHRHVLVRDLRRCVRSLVLVPPAVHAATRVGRHRVRIERDRELEPEAVALDARFAHRDRRRSLVRDTVDSAAGSSAVPALVAHEADVQRAVVAERDLRRASVGAGQERIAGPLAIFSDRVVRPADDLIRVVVAREALALERAERHRGLRERHPGQRLAPRIRRADHRLLPWRV